MEDRGGRAIIAIDLLRFACALLVVGFHFGTAFAYSPSQSSAILLAGLPVGSARGTCFGWIGVELFFVISGFVIAFSAESGGPGDFVRRRALRERERRRAGVRRAAARTRARLAAGSRVLADRALDRSVLLDAGDRGRVLSADRHGTAQRRPRGGNRASRAADRRAQPRFLAGRDALRRVADDGLSPIPAAIVAAGLLLRARHSGVGDGAARRDGGARRPDGPVLPDDLDRHHRAVERARASARLARSAPADAGLHRRSRDRLRRDR